MKMSFSVIVNLIVQSAHNLYFNDISHLMYFIGYFVSEIWTEWNVLQKYCVDSLTPKT